MLNQLLKRLCPCYFVETDENVRLCSRGVDGSGVAISDRTCRICSEKDFLCREEEGEEPSSIWKGTLNFVKPQPMYAVPYDVTDSRKHKDLVKPALCWTKATQNLSSKGPPVRQEWKRHKRKIDMSKYKNTCTSLQIPIKSNSEIVRLKSSAEIYSVKTERTVELRRFRSASLQNVPLEAASRNEGRAIEHEAGGDSDRDDKWYFFKDRKVYPDVSHGAVFFTAVHFDKKKSLLINVHRLENLSKKGREGFSYRTILKASLLDSEKHSKTSKILETSSNPRVEQEFTFPAKDLTDRVLRLSVFDASLQKRNDAIGHALLHLKDAVTNYPKKYRIKLYKRSQPHVTPGTLLVSLSFKPEDKKLIVIIDKAKSLRLQIDKYARLNTYVKVTLFSYGEKIKIKKSMVVTNSRDPSYNCAFTFNVDEDHVDHLSMLIAVKLRSFIKDLTIGHLILGPFFVEEDQKLTPWGRIFLKNETIAHWFRMYL